MLSLPKISIIIPTLNEESYIGSTLSHLHSQTRPANEIIVVDANSTDKTQSIVKKFPHVKLFTHAPSVALQRNLGAKKAVGEILIFLDADVLPNPHFLEALMSEFISNRFDCACPTYIPSSRKLATKIIFSFFNSMFRLFQKRAASGAGCCIIVRKKLLHHLQGFANLAAYEDIEFIRRASRFGKFGMLKTSLIVSDRRFIKYGIVPTFLKYLLLSCFFIAGKFNAAQRVTYPFGSFHNR